jgi:3-deoxy-D-manno-octulosonic-acid transferase
MRYLFDLLYLTLLVLALPWLVWRSVRTGRYRKHLGAKLFGRVTVDNPERKPVAWFHAVSVGEVHLLAVVVKAFRQRHPNWHVVVSSTTDTGLAEATARFPDCSVIAYPFDFSWACANVLDRVKPAIVLLAESEMWPNFLAGAARRKVPVVLFNARQSPRSFGRLKKVAGLARQLLFRHVDLFAVQSEDYAERFRLLGVPAEKIVVTGSVKYDGATGDKDSPKAKALAAWMNLPPGAVVWVAGSTHAPEEEIVLRVYERLLKAGGQRPPALYLILVPRHPDRFEEVAGLIRDSKFPSIRRSESGGTSSRWPRRGDDVAPLSHPVFLLDTIGELGAAWSLADIGFVGGSLAANRGGQSMIEPAGYGVPTLFGPNVWNFRDAANRLIEAGGAIKIADEAELEATMRELLADPERLRGMGRRARALVQAQQGATGRTMDAIDGVLAPEAKPL